MAATLLELQAMRANLVSARSRGVREVEDSNGRRVSYSSDAEMGTAIQFIDREMASLTGVCRTIRVTTSKGI